MSVNFNNKKKTDYSQLRHQAIKHQHSVQAAPQEVLGVPTEAAPVEPLEVENGKMDDEGSDNIFAEMDGDEQPVEADDEGPDSHEE